MQNEKSPDPKELVKAVRPWHIAILISFLGVAGLSLPWVWADDNSSAYNAVGILMHFPTAHDKWYTLKTTPLGSAISVMAPSLIIISVLSTSLIILSKQRVAPEAVGAAAITIASASLLLSGCKEILDPDRARVGPFNVPEAGLAVILASAVGLIGFYIWTEHLQCRKLPRLQHRSVNGDNDGKDGQSPPSSEAGSDPLETADGK